MVKRSKAHTDSYSVAMWNVLSYVYSKIVLISIQNKKKEKEKSHSAVQIVY